MGDGKGNWSRGIGRGYLEIGRKAGIDGYEWRGSMVTNGGDRCEERRAIKAGRRRLRQGLAVEWIEG
jgi:hypothetical protein